MGGLKVQTLHNPWRDVADKWLNSDGPYALEADNDLIYPYNKTRELNTKILLEALPDPYVGNLKNAEVYLLMINPGANVPPGFQDTGSNAFYNMNHDFKKAIVKNLKQEKQEFPFIYLNPKFRFSGGFIYWSRILQHFLNGDNYMERYKNISKKLCVIEYFPYHSMQSVKKVSAILNSQKYNFEMAKKAVNEGKLVIIMRAVKEWCAELGIQLPNDLKSGTPNPLRKNTYYINRRSAILSSKNLSDKIYNQIKTRLG